MVSIYETCKNTESWLGIDCYVQVLLLASKYIHRLFLAQGFLFLNFDSDFQVPWQKKDNQITGAVVLMRKS